jgi:hypothetical protein
MGAIILPIDNETSLDQGMRRNGTQASNPPLGGSEGGAMDDPLVGVSVEGGSGLELGQVGSVAEFGLGVASNDLVLLCERAPVLCLLVRSLCVDDWDECRLMQADL